MAIVATPLLGVTSTVDASSYVTASITPTANSLVLAYVKTRTSGPEPSVPTLTGNGLTWVAVITAYAAVDSENYKGTLFRAMGASPSAGALTIDLGGQTQTHGSVSICEFAGVDTSGTNGSGAIVQALDDIGLVVSSLTINLAALESFDNMAYGAFYGFANQAITPGSGFTEIHDLPVSENAAMFQTEYKLNETAVSASWVSTTNTLGVAVEIRAAVADEAVTSLTSGSSTVDASSYATASVTPTANSLVLVAVYSRQAVSTTTPTLTGNGMTWVSVNSTLIGTGTNRRITVFRSLHASPSAGAITIDFAANTQTQCIWSVVEFADVDTSGTNGSGAIVQSGVAATDNATSLTVTLSAFSDANNMAYGAFNHNADEDTAPGSGFTEIHDVHISENATGMFTEYKLNDNTVDASWANAFAMQGAVAIEITAQAAAAPGVTGSSFLVF